MMNFATLIAKSRLPAVLALAGALAALPAHATLVDNGDGTVTDTDSHLMWAKDANLFETLYNALADNAAKDSFISALLSLTPTYNDPLGGTVTLSTEEWFTGGDSYVPDHTATGRMTIFGAIAFVNWLNSTNWSGHNDWRLPVAKPIKGGAFDLGTAGNSFYDGSKDQSHNFTNSRSELVHMYYDVFGMQAMYTTGGILRDSSAEYGINQVNPPIDLSPFQNFQAAEYFTSTFNNADFQGTPSAMVWTTNFNAGVQHLSDRNLINLGPPDGWIYLPSSNGHVWVVRDFVETATAVLGNIDAFGEQEVGTTSSPKTVSLSNTGTAAYGIKSITATAEFGTSHDCGTSLGAGQSCSIQVTFSPALAGSRTGTLTVTPTAGSALTLSLTGTGIGSAPNPELGTPEDFGDQPIYSASAPQAITLTNSGTADFAIASITASGDFAVVSQTCGETLAAGGANCSISVTFTPTATGSRSGTLTVTQASSGATVTANLSGNGISAGHLAAAPARLDFGAVAGGKVVKTVLMLANDGTEDLRVGTLSRPEAPFSAFGDRCSGKLLKPGKSCKVGFKFSSSGGEEPVTGTALVSAEGLGDLAIELSGRTGEPGEVADVAAQTPDIGFRGRIVLSGKEFTSRPGKLKVGGKRATILAWTDTAIVATAPKLGEGSHTVEIIRKGAPGNGQASVTVHKPELIQLDAESGPAGAVLTLSGRYFGAGKPAVRFQPAAGGKVVTVKPKSGNSDGRLQVVVPKRLKAGNYGVVVKNPAGSSDALTFSVD